jgi:hypothetical protein
MKNLDNMIKEKQFRLILREPGRGDKVLAEGSESFVSKERTKLSFKYNPDFLVISEVAEDEVEELSTPGIIVSLALSLIILLIYGKKRK